MVLHFSGVFLGSIAPTKGETQRVRRLPSAEGTGQLTYNRYRPL